MSDYEVHRIVRIDSSFDGIIATASLSGCNTAPMIDGERYIGFGQTQYGYGPVCILDVKETPYVIEPHVVWFPWTPAKERIRAFKWAMEHFSQEKQVFLIVFKQVNSLFEHFVKKNVLRKVGFINNLPPEAGEEIHMYQYMREK